MRINLSLSPRIYSCHMKAPHQSICTSRCSEFQPAHRTLRDRGRQFVCAVIGTPLKMTDTAHMVRGYYCIALRFPVSPEEEEIRDPSHCRVQQAAEHDKPRSIGIIRCALFLGNAPFISDHLHKLVITAPACSPAMPSRQTLEVCKLILMQSAAHRSCKGPLRAPTAHP